MLDEETKIIVYWIKMIAKVSVFLSIACFTYLSFIHPYVHVWQEGLKGQAELARADANRQIAICEAVAKKESSKALAEAEIIRAEGVAQANKIIGDSLSGNESYLRYLWIQGLQSDHTQIVYIPTEANLPILEANRLK